MAASKPTPDTGPNWAVVGLGTLLLVLVVAAVPDIVLRAIAAAIIMGGTFYLAQSREELQVENPLLEQLRTHKTEGLDRRKYGRLRSRTDRLLDQVRQMNRIAIEGREGRLSPRHAHAELDRIAALMRDTIDEIRKSAGVPTPIEELGARGSKAAQPQVVLPKASREGPASEEAPASVLHEAAAEEYEADEADRMLDELEAQAEAESAARVEEQAEPQEDEAEPESEKAGELMDSSADEEEEEEPEEDEEESEEDEEESEEDEEESEEDEDDSEKTR
jgi:hypothetical protein